MAFTTLSGVTLHHDLRGGSGRPVVFLNSLGTDFRIWDGVMALLPQDMPALRMDKRGHGLSDGAPITLDVLVQDAAALMDHHGLSDALVCGVSVGGVIAQALATARPDLVAGLVLCCTGAKIGEAEMWDARIAAVTESGIAPMAEAILDRWFSPAYRGSQPAALAGYGNMLTRTSVQGYAGVCGVLRDADLTESSARLTCPAHCIAGAQDAATPPDLVRQLAQIIPHATFEVFDSCGHLPSIEQPAFTARALLHQREALG